MFFLKAGFSLVLIGSCQCFDAEAEGERLHPSRATAPEECSSLLQVDMTRTSQAQKLNANSEPTAEVETNSPRQQVGPQRSGNESESQDVHGALLVTNDVLKRMGTLHTGSAILSQTEQAATGALNSSSAGQGQTSVLQKPYLELHIYFDLMVVVFALVLFFLLPQALGTDSDEHSDARAQLPPYLPALASLRYLSMVSVWLRYHWFTKLFDTSEFVLMLAGFVLEYAEQRKSDDDANESMSFKYQQFIPRRFARLYPLFALHVIIGVLSNVPTCDPIRSLLLYQCWGYGDGTFESGKLVYNSCGIGTWFVSVLFGCYFLFPVLSRPMRHIPSAGTTMLWAGCSMFIILPRALASPAGNHNIWWDDVFRQDPEKVTVGLVELLISKRSLLHALAHFFMGMVLARTWVSSSLLDMSGSDEAPSSTRRIIMYGCTLGAIALGAQWFTVFKHPNMLHSGYGVRLLSEAWRVSFQSALMLGAAGPCTSGVKCDLARGFLSMPLLLKLSELALPLYLTVSWACAFSDKLMVVMGVSQKGSLSQGTYFVAQLVVTHVIALAIYQSCGALTSSVTKTVVKEAT